MFTRTNQQEQVMQETQVFPLRNQKILCFLM